jgi:hypothetical protein
MAVKAQVTGNAQALSVASQASTAEASWCAGQNRTGGVPLDHNFAGEGPRGAKSVASDPFKGRQLSLEQAIMRLEQITRCGSGPRLIATLAAMLRDERGTWSKARAASSQFNRGVSQNHGALTRYPFLLQALEDGYQVYDQAPGVYFLRQRFAEGWKFARVISGDEMKSTPNPTSGGSSVVDRAVRSAT